MKDGVVLSVVGSNACTVPSMFRLVRPYGMHHVGRTHPEGHLASEHRTTSLCDLDMKISMCFSLSCRVISDAPCTLDFCLPKAHFSNVDSIAMH